ncbi:MAG: hypothetical protein Q9161_008922 [Pseudevernia consocians]
MSRSKRRWDNIGTGTIPSEVASVKRRAVSRLSVPFFLNDSSIDDNSDQDMTSITIESTSAALSEVRSVPSSSTSPRRSTSPASTQLGHVSGKIGEQQPSRRGVCFEEIGVLDKKMAAALKSLKEIATSITIELFLDHEQDQDSYNPGGKKGASVCPLQIQIYGPDDLYNEVGSALSSAGMYLQEPVFLDCEVVYRNPHFLSWDDSPETPLLRTAWEDPKAGFTAKIEAIMDSFKPVLQASDVKQDARILTTLRKYDII